MKKQFDELLFHGDAITGSEGIALMVLRRRQLLDQLCVDHPDAGEGPSYIRTAWALVVDDLLFASDPLTLPDMTITTYARTVRPATRSTAPEVSAVD